MEYCYKFDSLHLHIDGPSQKIVVDKCCLKGWEEKNWIKSWTFEEFLALEDVYSELDKLKNVYPTTFDNKGFKICPDGVTQCDFSRYECKKLQSIEVAIDAHCNAKCRFCGLDRDHVKYLKESGKFNLTEEVYFKTLESLKGHSLKNIRLTDVGEPFFFKKRTIEFLKSLTPNDVEEICFNSNFIGILPEELEDLVQNTQIKLSPIVSLNGWDEQSYSEIMGVSGKMFNRVVDNIRVLRKNKVNFQVSFVIDREEEIPFVHKFCSENLQLLSRIMVFAETNSQHLWGPINKYFKEIGGSERAPILPKDVHSYEVDEKYSCGSGSNMILKFNNFGEPGKVSVYKCCTRLYEQPIDVIDLEEFNKISDVYGYLSELQTKEPKNWNQDCSQVGKCDFWNLQNKKLLDVGVFLSFACNLKCKFCHLLEEGNSSTEIVHFNEANDVYFSTLEKLKGNSLRTLYLTEAGEPFVFKEKTLKYLESLNRSSDVNTVCIHTNATTLDIDDLERLLQIDPAIHLHISLNGWDRESYINICGKDCFEKVVENIRFLAKKEKLLPKFKMSVSFAFTEEYAYEHCIEFGKFISKGNDFEVQVNPDFGNAELNKKCKRVLIKNGEII